MRSSSIAQGQGGDHSVLEAIPPVCGQASLPFLALPQVHPHLHVYIVGSIPMRLVHHRQRQRKAENHRGEVCPSP